MQLITFDYMHWVSQCLAMAVAALLIPNLKITSIFGPILAVVALALINTFVWNSTLFSALPNQLSSQTVTLLCINGLIFWAVVKILPGIETKGILPSLVAPVVFTVCSLAIPKVARIIDWPKAKTQAMQVVTETKRLLESSQSEAANRPH